MEIDRLSKALISLGVIMLALGLLFCIMPLTRTIAHTITVEAEGFQWAAVRLDKGDRIGGHFTVIGGNGDIDFCIRDPYASVILDAGRVTGGRDFALVAEYTGIYNCCFDNGFSVSANKTILFSYSGAFMASQRSVALIVVLIGVLIALPALYRINRARSSRRRHAVSRRRLEHTEATAVLKQDRSLEKRFSIFSCYGCEV